MLSFMREQGIETTKQGNDTPGKPVELPGTMPASSSEQYLTVSHKKQVRKSNYLLIILFCAGLLILWFMIKKSTPQTAAASATGNSQIETLLTKFAGVRSEMFSSLDEISDRFYKFSDVQQVKNNELVKNPFKVEVVCWNNSSLSPTTKAADYSAIAAAATARQADSERYTGNMQLLSIMESDGRKCCMIDNKILYEGDLIKGFRIRQIGDNLIKLEQETPNDPNGGKGNSQTEIILKLSE